MISGTHAQSSATQLEQFLPKFVDEQGISIKHKAVRHPMMFSNNVHEEEWDNMSCIIRLQHTQFYSFWESVYDYQNGSMTPICWQVDTKVQWKIFPWSLRNRQGSKQPDWFSRLILCVLIVNASCNKSTNIFSNAWPNKIVSQSCHGLLNAHVTTSGGGMKFN